MSPRPGGEVNALRLPRPGRRHCPPLALSPRSCRPPDARPFGAGAELLGSAHHSVTANFVCTDVVELKGHPYLTFMDNGAGMTPCKLYSMLRNKDRKPDLDFDTDKHDTWIAEFLADDGEIPSRKVLQSQKMVPEFPGPQKWSTHYGSDTLKVSDLEEEAAQMTDERQFVVKPDKQTVGFVSTFRLTWFN
ncbi:unnamed protein product [Bubo scandiacus]